MKKKNVGLLIPNLYAGGAERVMALTSEILSKRGHNVFIILYDKNNISYDYSGNVIDINSKAGNNFLVKVIKRIERIIKLTYYKRKYNLDFVISFLYSANVVNYFSLGKTKKILSCRGYGDYIENGKKYSIMLNKVNSFIVQTERMKKDFIKDFNSDKFKLNVLYNPFDIDLIINKAEHEIEENIKNFIDDHKTICTVGSFKRDKGYWHLIKSFIKVKKHVKNAGLVFIGHRGEMEKDLKSMAKLSGFDDDILFLGYRENPFKYISRCDLYVCSSIYEGFPNALVEAMACGISVLSTDCKTGPREILMKDNISKKINKVKFADFGILTPELTSNVDLNVDNINSNELIMAEGIIKLLNNKKTLKEYSNLSKIRAYEFNLKEYSERLSELIES